MAKTTACHDSLKAFGSDLQDYLYADPGGWNILPLAYSTWLQGGCWVLAQALHEWIGAGSELWAIFDVETDLMQHVVLRVKGCYLDGDGASSRDELLQRWEREEFTVKPFLKRFVAEEASEIECPVGAVRDLVAALNTMFGPGDKVVAWASGRS